MQAIPWGPIRSELLENFSFGDIKRIVGYAGIDMGRLAHLEQRQVKGASKSELLSAIDLQLQEADIKRSGQIASICCEEIIRRNPQLIEKLDAILARVGWRFIENSLIPIDIFDVSELKKIPTESQHDIIKAATRLRDGDLSGTISAICGALDSTTNVIYKKYNIGEPDKATFQERVKKSMSALNIKEEVQSTLTQLNWTASDINPFVSNLEGAINQASYVMQKLRSNMGDVHGTKPVFSTLVYDSFKWGLLILSLLNIKK